MISLVLFVLLMFLTDLVIRQATVGKLDRTAYSVASLMRERIQLFEGRERLNQQDVDIAAGLARRMLSDMHSKADLSRLQIHVEEMHFKDPTGQTDLRKEIQTYARWNNGKEGAQCLPPEPLTNQLQLTPRGSYGRWVPLYQVTVCLPTTSWFVRLFAGEENPLLTSFAIVMLR
ncbi:tight adherence pilus pseudopilin TadF [Erwinia sp.]|uniref:tight adherence pilus pseudopilin TadF n=1 Tax=Erwinia citreus TaxID=558 RepID=UPI003C76401B